MCRLVAGWAWGREGSSVLGELAVLTAEAARGDPYLAAVTGGEDRHCHGYGFLLVYRPERGGAWRLVFERYDALEEGAEGEGACRANLEAARGAAERLRGLLAAAEEALLVFHVRRASKGEPRGSLNAHPYPYRVAAPGGSVELYLAHNGGVDKTGLAEALGVEGPEGFTDSFLLEVLVAKRVAEGASVEEALAEGYRYTRSGYDIALVVLRDTLQGVEPGMYIAAGMARGLDESSRKYYEPVLFTATHAAGYVSSTVRDLAEEKGVAAEFWSSEWGVYRITPGEGLAKTGELRG